MASDSEEVRLEEEGKDRRMWEKEEKRIRDEEDTRDLQYGLTSGKTMISILQLVPDVL